MSMCTIFDKDDNDVILTFSAGALARPGSLEKSKLAARMGNSTFLTKGSRPSDPSSNS